MPGTTMDDILKEMSGTYQDAYKYLAGGGGGKGGGGEYQEPEAGPGYQPYMPEKWEERPGGTLLQYEETPEKFDLEKFAQSYGFAPRTPTGQEMPSRSYEAFAKFIEDQYGMSPEDFLGAGSQEQYKAWAKEHDVARSPGGAEKMGLIDPITGMPTRPPKSPQEAGLFQWLSGEQTRRKNQELLRNAVATMQYAFGVLRQGGPGSLAAFQSPTLTSLASIYHTSEYKEPDYSYWLLPEAYGAR